MESGISAQKEGTRGGLKCVGTHTHTHTHIHMQISTRMQIELFMIVADFNFTPTL